MLNPLTGHLALPLQYENAIKVGFCVAYDWRMLAYSLPMVYKSAGVICLSIDCDRLSWAQKPFAWNESDFRQFVRDTDIESKVIIYEDNFHLSGLSPGENEKRQRRLMSEKMGEGGWHIQLDCDEYFFDFDAFAKYLKCLPGRSYKYNLTCQLITVFKQVDHGFLYVSPTNQTRLEFLQVASRNPEFEHGRRNGHFNVFTGFKILHQSWARDESDIMQKLSNWGHVQDFDVMEYFRLWKSVTMSNYQTFKNFHPIDPEAWPTLRFIEADDINNLINNFRKVRFPSLNPLGILIKNSLWISRLTSISRRMCRIMFSRG